MTSIKVSTELRDRVRRLAHQRRMSQTAYLDRLLRETEEGEFWRRMAEASAGEYQAALAEDGDPIDEDYGIEESLIADEEQ